jgi:hypothetical protein
MVLIFRTNKKHKFQSHQKKSQLEKNMLIQVNQLCINFELNFLQRAFVTTST